MFSRKNSGCCRHSENGSFDQTCLGRMTPSFASTIGEWVLSAKWKITVRSSTTSTSEIWSLPSE